MQLAHLQLKSCDVIICLCIFSGQREDKGEQANTKKCFYKQKKKKKKKRKKLKFLISTHANFRFLPATCMIGYTLLMCV
jgi:hypothetical protein